jgi:hypothetical protein
MNTNIIYFSLLLLSIGCGNAEHSKSNVLNQVLEQEQDPKTNFELDFPVKPEITSEVLPIQGQQTNLITKVAKVENGMYLLFELDLGGLTDQVKKDQTGFFNGMLSYLIGDLGAQYENLTDYEYNGFKGNNFDIISPNKDEKRTAKGKTLLVDNKAYIWFGVSKDQDSLERVNKFINSFKLK